MDKAILHRNLTVFYRVERADIGVPDPPGQPGSPPAAASPVLLLHGFAEDGSLWDGQVEYLKKDHHLIIPDLPGSGRSAPLAGEITMEELADSIKAILDAEEIGQVVMIGHSMGGYITLAFAAKYPERLQAFGLFHSTAYADTEEKRAVRRKGIEFIRRNGSAPFIKQTTPDLFSEKTRRERPQIVADLVSRYADFNPDSLVHYYEAMIGRPDRTEIVKRSAGPVLFIIGEQDSAIPLRSILPQTHLPASAYIHILENAGHMGMLEEAQRSNTILKGFLSGLRQGSW